MWQTNTSQGFSLSWDLKTEISLVSSQNKIWVYCQIAATVKRRICSVNHLHEHRNWFIEQHISVYNVFVLFRGAPNGTYWLCGKMAYCSIPSNWGGTCTVGFVVTVMRTVPNNKRDLNTLFKDYRPSGMWRDKISLADITHTQAPASRFLGVFFLGYGVACALDQIRDISRHRENWQCYSKCPGTIV